MDYLKNIIPNSIHEIIGLSNGEPDGPLFDLIRPEVALKIYFLLWIAQALPFPFSIIFSRVGVLLNIGTSLAVMSSMAVLEGAYTRRILASQEISSGEKVHMAFADLYLLGITLPTSIGPTRLFYFHAVHNILPLWLIKTVPSLITFL